MSNKWQKGDLIPLLGGGSAKPEHVLETETFSSNYGKEISGKMKDNSAISLDRIITTQKGKVVIPQGYTPGGEISANFQNLEPKNIRSGVNIGGILGNLTGVDLDSISIYNSSVWSNDTESIYFGSHKAPIFVLRDTYVGIKNIELVYPDGTIITKRGEGPKSGRLIIDKVSSTEMILRNNDSHSTVGYITIRFSFV